MGKTPNYPYEQPFPGWLQVRDAATGELRGWYRRHGDAGCRIDIRIQNRVPCTPVSDDDRFNEFGERLDDDGVPIRRKHQEHHSFPFCIAQDHVRRTQYKCISVTDEQLNVLRRVRSFVESTDEAGPRPPASPAPYLGAYI